MALVPKDPSWEGVTDLLSKQDPSWKAVGDLLSKRKSPPKPKVKPPNPNSGDLAGPLFTMWPLTNEFRFKDAVGTVQEVSSGYDANASVIASQLRHEAAMSRANAILTEGQDAGSFQMSIFVTNARMDSSITGSTGQSQMLKDFYPHSFVAPVIRVIGWSLNQADYGLLCEFIHTCQQKSITSNSDKWPNFMTQICIFGRDGQSDGKGGSVTGTTRGLDGTHQGPAVKKVTLSQPEDLMPNYQADPPNKKTQGNYYNQSIRGGHQTIVAKGYIASMPRAHKRFEYAVQWEFDFVVAAMLQGLYKDNVAYGGPLPTWMDVLNEAKGVGLSTVSAKENKAALAFAAQNSASLLGAPDPGGGGGGGGAPGAPSSGTPPTLKGGATNPAPGATWGRLDQGFDGNYGSAGAVAPFDGTIEGNDSRSGWPGQGAYFAVVNADQSGPDYTRVMYFAEGATPIYTNGTRVKAGQKIGNPVSSGGDGSPGNFEIGPGNTTNFDPLARTYGLGSTGARTMVLAFEKWLVSLGAQPSPKPIAAGNH